MKSTDLVYQLENNNKIPLSKVKEDGSGKPGIYAMWFQGKMNYVGKTATSQVDRVGNQHAKGNSCTSSYVNYLRAEHGITVTPQERAMVDISIPTLKIEEAKVRSFLETNITCSFVEVDPSTALEDSDKKPEDYLFEHYKEEGVDLLNNPTKGNRKLIKEADLDSLFS
jgi:hypothetical protein